MRYEAQGWIKFAEQDSYEHGCLEETSTMQTGDTLFEGETIQDVIDQCVAFVPFVVDGDAIQRDSCDEIGRLDISGMETVDGTEPYQSDLEAWKKGEQTLWYVTYTFHIEAVERTSVSLS